MTEQDIFMAAIDLHDAAARTAFLDKVCAGNRPLRTKVEALLRSHDTAGSFLGTPAVAPPDPEYAPTRVYLPTPPPTGEPTEGEGSVNEADEEALAFLAPPGRADSLGRLGHYEVLQVLGRGGFGIVFRAFDDVLQRVVAVKVLSPQMAATSPARKRFLREARTSAQVRHENVVQVHAVEEHPLPYLVMEFIPGETLQQRLDRTGPLDVPEILRIGRQIAEGLAAAHACDLVHRDIKPGNILMEGGQHKVKITDFGLARAADDASISQSGIIAGTPMFMAPEQAKGESLDQRADLFSLGSVLYQMVTGRPPFRANGTLAVLKRVAEDNPRAIREIIPETPQWVCDIISKLHAKNPDDRFQSAREVADVLAECEARLKMSSDARGFPKAAPSALVETVAQVPAAGTREFGWVWAAAGALIVWAAAAALIVGAIVAGVAALVPVNDRSREQAKTDKGEQPPAPRPGPPPLAIAPFDAAKAKEHQDAWAKHLGVPVEYANSVGMKFRLIPPGEFMMGSTAKEIEKLLEDEREASKFLVNAEGPQRSVRLSSPYYMGTFEVTQAEYLRVMGVNPSDFAKTGKAAAKVEGIDTDTFPVENLSWDDAVEFCKKLSGLPREREAGRVYRLATEAQWEYACRAGTVCRFHTGDTLQLTDANFANSLARPHSVGTFSANAFGLHDMPGNVFEWCHDWFAPDYRDLPALDPQGPAAGEARVVRGANYGYRDRYCRSASRDRFQPIAKLGGVGFRVVTVGDLKPRVSPATQDPVAKAEPPPPTFKNGIGMEFVIVPKGKSWLGGGKDRPGDQEVVIPADFYLGKYEVTQEEWIRVTGENPSHFRRKAGANDPVKGVSDEDLKRFPVDNISWDQTQQFLLKLNQLEKETGWVYRLPTEVEWEYACRGGPMADKADSAFDFYPAKPTNTLAPEQANIGKETGLNRTCKVGSFAANRLGLFDMHGNVCEWCDDAEKSGGLRINRGGGWNEVSAECAAARRTLKQPTSRYNHRGLRVARVPVGTPVPETKAPPAGEPDLAAAKYVLSVGGIVKINEQEQELKAAADLPAEAFRLTVASLRESKTVTDAGLVALKDCKNLASLNLSFTEVGDAGVAHFRACRSLTSLDIRFTKLTDAGLANAKEWKNLTYLNLTACEQVTDEGLTHLKDCKNLESLALDGTQVTDAGLAHLKGCSNLKELQLPTLPITDDGLTHLAGLDQLTELNLAKTKVTEKGIDVLKKALPKCKITWDGVIEPK